MDARFIVVGDASDATVGLVSDRRVSSDAALAPSLPAQTLLTDECEFGACVLPPAETVVDRARAGVDRGPGPGLPVP